MADQGMRQLANAQMQRGRDLMASGRRDTTLRALALFDYALRIRRGSLPAEPRNLYDCAGAWLNRAEALLALGDSAQLEAALQAFDAAVAVLGAIPLDAEPRAARRLAIALQNRALTRRRLARDEWTVMPDLFRALALTGTLQERGSGELRLLEAALWVHVAQGQSSECDAAAWQRALQSAALAVGLLGDLEWVDPQASSIGLTARHICCAAVARCLTGGASLTDDELISQASDAVDDGLALIAEWERRGHTSFRAIGADLFEFGRRLYSSHQPQFVAEFEAECARLGQVLVAPR